MGCDLEVARRKEEGPDERQEDHPGLVWRHHRRGQQIMAEDDDQGQRKQEFFRQPGKKGEEYEARSDRGDHFKDEKPESGVERQREIDDGEFYCDED